MAERLPRYLLAASRLLGGAGLLVLAVLPAAWLEQAPSLCLFKNAFGIECFGCGMTRAISSALHGHLAAALAYNRGVVVALPLLLAFVIVPGAWRNQRWTHAS